MGASTPLVEFSHFSFQYRAQSSPTLKDICLSVYPGEKILILGPSGCGKSTLIHCINGLVPFSYKGEMKGSLKLAGKETAGMSLFEISRKVGTVLQDSDAQFVGLTVAEDLAFALENDCVTEPQLHEKVKAAAELVNVSDYLSHFPGELSGGQKQRVSLGGVLVDSVELLLFDEPLANLDPATGKSAMELIDDMQKKTGTTVIIVEHRLEDALWRHVDRVVLMNEGCITADCSPDELLSSDILTSCGIREPLYITALRYADVNVTADMHPWSIREIRLEENEKEKVRSLFGGALAAATAPKRDTIISARNVSFSYPNGRRALNDVSLDIYRGEMLAIVGSNGAGKSTLAKVICGFERQQQGSISFCGEDMKSSSIKEIADHIGYVMQNPNQMISKIKIWDEVALGLVTRGASKEKIQEKVEKVLRICGLWKFRNWPVSVLSYGQKKRVTIASILALDPEVIILDEPTAGQDYRHYTEIMEFLLALKALGITIVMITHDMHLMLEYADRSLVFSEGKLLGEGTGAQVITSSRLAEKASLKVTSLYDLSMMCGAEDPSCFAQSFIDYERKTASSLGEVLS